ncbi:MAG: hypothetical protein PVH12_02650 [Candidatus Bathyarchaeota archaeon]
MALSNCMAFNRSIIHRLARACKHQRPDLLLDELVLEALFWFGGSLLMLVFFPIYLYRTRIEESSTLEEFGDEYRESMKMTKKIIPFIY